jgi:hypothetical protein
MSLVTASPESHGRTTVGDALDIRLGDFHFTQAHPFMPFLKKKARKLVGSARGKKGCTFDKTSTTALANCLPFVEGKDVRRFKSLHLPQHHVVDMEMRNKMNGKTMRQQFSHLQNKPEKMPRIVLQAMTDLRGTGSPRRRLCSTILPMQTLTAHSALVLRASDGSEPHFFVGLLNSMLLNYLFWIESQGENIVLSIVKALPLPRPDEDTHRSQGALDISADDIVPPSLREAFELMSSGLGSKCSLRATAACCTKALLEGRADDGLIHIIETCVFMLYGLSMNDATWIQEQIAILSGRGTFRPDGKHTMRGEKLSQSSQPHGKVRSSESAMPMERSAKKPRKSIRDFFSKS